MARTAVFAGLVADENARPVAVTHVGQEAYYVVDDGEFCATYPRRPWIVTCWWHYRKGFFQTGRRLSRVCWITWARMTCLPRQPLRAP